MRDIRASARHSITACLFILCCPALGAPADEWEQLTSLPAGRHNEDIFDLVPTQTASLAVGTNGTVLRVTTNDTFIEEDSGTTADLYAVHCLSSKCVFSGFDVIAFNSYDGNGWQHIIDTTGTGNHYTPVLATTDRIYFGMPALDGLGFNYLCYQPYDGSFGMCRAISGGSLMALAETSTGIRGITRQGDITEWSSDFTVAPRVLFHPDEPEDVVRGGCGIFYQNECHAVLKESPGSYAMGWHSGEEDEPWTVTPIPYTMDAIGFLVEPDPLSQAGLPPMYLTVVGSDTGSLARIYSTCNGGTTWLSEADDLPPAVDYPLLAAAVVPNALGGTPMRLVAGSSGTFLVAPLRGTLFSDGFESGDSSRWSLSSP